MRERKRGREVDRFSGKIVRTEMAYDLCRTKNSGFKNVYIFLFCYIRKNFPTQKHDGRFPIILCLIIIL